MTLSPEPYEVPLLCLTLKYYYFLRIFAIARSKYPLSTSRGFTKGVSVVAKRLTFVSESRVTPHEKKATLGRFLKLDELKF